MTIRTKLLLLSVGTATLFLGAFGLYFVILSPLGPMKDENRYILELDRCSARLQVESNKWLSETFDVQESAYRSALEAYRKANDNMARVVLLPKADQTIAGAVNAVMNIRDLTESSVAALAESTASVREAAKSLKLGDSEADYSQLQRAASADKTGQGEADFALGSLVRNIQTLNQTLSETRRVIEEKDDIIAAETAKLEASSTAAALLVILAAILVSLGLSLSLATTIGASLRAMGQTLSSVSEGDLTLSFASVQKDEVGRVAWDLNCLLQKLNAAFWGIQSASARNLALKDSLAVSVSTATSSATEIEASSDAILRMMKIMDQRLGEAAGEISAITGTIEAFHARLGLQDERVRDSSRVIGAMLASLAEVSRVGAQTQDLATILGREADHGQEVFQASFEKVAEISDTVVEIKNLVGVISEIASQTNILALNAAIEAAHAGEYGKGFSVVADEIAKLASASAVGSSQIQATIQDILRIIGLAVETKEESLATFNVVFEKIREVSSSVATIRERTHGLTLGSQEIQDSMEVVSFSSSENLGESQRIAAATTAMRENVDRVERVSHEVVSNIGEISLGLRSILTTVQDVAENADRLGIVGFDLDTAVNAFVTRSVGP